MSPPIPYYQQVVALNDAVLAALETHDWERVVLLMEERRAWMRPANTPTPEEEAREKAPVLALMRTILDQDARIGESLVARQREIAEAMQGIQRTRVAQGYKAPSGGAPEAKFVDRDG